MIKDFHGYKVSDDGIVYGKDGHPLKQMMKNNVPIVCLWIDGCRYQLYVRVVVASAFIDNPNNYKSVINLDKNMKNNSVHNLMWVERNHGGKYGGKRCAVYTHDGHLIKRYKSCSEAGRDNGVSQGVIRHYITGKMRDKRGYKWEFVDE